MSEISSILALRSVILLFVFNSKLGRGAFASSSLDIKLKYLFSKSKPRLYVNGKTDLTTKT